MVIAVTGAAGNLGSRLSRHLLQSTPFDLRLLVHRHHVPPELLDQTRVRVVQCDLARPESLGAALEGADCVIHFAGVLFKARPERFLPTTNTTYFRNLLDTAIEKKVRRIILISFPHVEGQTTPDAPATGRLDGNPVSAHAQTRLEEEKFLFAAGGKYGFEAVSLRVGKVYGRGILMVDAAHWLAKRNLLGVWRDPTWIHLISVADFLAATTAAIANEAVHGVFHLGDEGHQTLQEFLDLACGVWGARKPWRMPLSLIYFAARLCEIQSTLFGTKSPLTRDFITIGRCSYYGDTARMRSALLPVLKYPTFREGKTTLS